jgi:hypothetical protein
MACSHKFAEYLNLERIDFEPTTLIVGTFKPGWENINNNAPWFYGRTHDLNGNQNNNFWDVLPRLYEEQSLINNDHNAWKDFCSRKKIAITDIIQKIEDALAIGELQHRRRNRDSALALHLHPVRCGR